MKISGNTILITGGGSGIGAALAGALHAKGNRVIVAGRRRDALESVTAAHPGMATATLDVSDEDAIASGVERIVADHPDLNVVIHNAGIMIAEDVTTDPYDLSIAEGIIATNLLGPIRLTAALLPYLKRQPRASIVTVSSGLAFVPLVATPTYNATKAAIHSWTQAIRAQLADTSVDVMEIVPPAVATDLMPGHADNPNSMPLGAFTDEVMALIEANPEAPEIHVERVKFLSEAERRGEYGQVFGMLNAQH